MTSTVELEASKRAKLLAPMAALMAGVLLLLAAPSVSWAAEADESRVPVVVQARTGGTAAAERLVTALGGAVQQRLPLIEGFAATVPSSVLPALEAASAVRAVTEDYALRPLQAEAGDLSATELGSMSNLARMMGADALWGGGVTGKGVDVALIDTGVVPVEGLTAPGKVAHGPDLSFDSQVEGLQHLDGYGHGTAMASIIAARDSSITDPAVNGGAGFQGVAPDAGIVSVKVGAANGAVDVSQVIAAIDWVVQHRTSGGRNIRVLNLSYGTDSSQPHDVDPLSYAAEVAWRKGIVVVAATGNDGRGTQLAMPAANPHIIAVGASDHMGTLDTADDRPADFSTYANGRRRPDLLAPGTGIVGLRVQGSYLDAHHPAAVRGERFFRGSGTSQAAAATSGAVALLLEQRPELTPDEVKALLTGSATALKATSNNAQGAGLIDLRKAGAAPTPKKVQKVVAGTGTGSLDAARGSDRVALDDVELTGEQDIFGTPWDSIRWSADAWAGRSWNDGVWNSIRWSGSDWSTEEWSSIRWSSIRWSSIRWSTGTWTGADWSDAWSSIRWSSIRWSADDAEWSSIRWSSIRWSSIRWSSIRWSSSQWA